ncbi:MAG: rRNA maturation RNase YbeY [Chitinophagaceae bacterium]|nr:MAG: rRNA maturation RNase YbeY [Chitinophagaceae bacterium]
MQFHFLNKTLDLKKKKKKKYKSWLKLLAKSHMKKIEHINLIVCTDDYLLEINRKHLNHDYYTDIITFDLSVNKKLISGDLFISYDRVLENAIKFQTSPKRELRRVVAHGLLHLFGFKDKLAKDKEIMTIMENKALELWKEV